MVPYVDLQFRLFFICKNLLFADQIQHDGLLVATIAVFCLCAMSFVVMEILRVNFLRNDVKQRLQIQAIIWRLFRVWFSQSNSTIVFKLYVI